MKFDPREVPSEGQIEVIGAQEGWLQMSPLSKQGLDGPSAPASVISVRRILCGSGSRRSEKENAGLEIKVDLLTSSKAPRSAGRVAQTRRSHAVVIGQSRPGMLSDLHLDEVVDPGGTRGTGHNDAKSP